MYAAHLGIPPAFCVYFNENKLMHQHNTRQKGDFHTIVQSEIEKGQINLTR